MNDREWEQVRLHPYYTERVLANSSELARIGDLAALHHERLDGSGYFRGVNAAMLSPAARILAAANTYCALTERRAHRPACSPEEAPKHSSVTLEPAGSMGRWSMLFSWRQATRRRRSKKKSWPG